jgi:hypothetical protein
MGVKSDERITWETCLRLRGGVHVMRRTEEPRLGRSQSVRSSASKPRDRRNEPHGPKASNDRWSEGTQEDG